MGKGREQHETGGGGAHELRDDVGDRVAHGERLTGTSAIVTAGLMCPPDTCPIAETTATITRKKVSEIKTIPGHAHQALGMDCGDHDPRPTKRERPERFGDHAPGQARRLGVSTPADAAI
jgi:hypothetical protein